MDNKSSNNTTADNWFKARGYRHKIILGSILSTLVLFGGLGWLIDFYLNSKPMGFIVGVIFSFFVSQYIIYKKLSQYTKKILDQ